MTQNKISHPLFFHISKNVRTFAPRIYTYTYIKSNFINFLINI